MADAFTQAGAVKNPSRYSAATMGGEQFTGLWTQRSPYRDAASAYLVKKFYAGSRFDSIIDGINREINMNLEDARSAGSSVYNGNVFPAAYSMANWQYVQNGAERVRVLLDGQDGFCYDATAGQKLAFETKASNGAQARFLGVNTQLFAGDGANPTVWTDGSITWAATTTVAPGQLINATVNGTPYLQMALGGIVLEIVAFETINDGGGVYTTYVYTNQQMVPAQFPNLLGVEVTFSGLTAATFLNGQTLAVNAVPSTTLGVFAVTAGSGAIAYTPDTGQGTTGNGITGGAAPAFSALKYNSVADGGQQWKCYGNAVKQWGLQGPAMAPVITPKGTATYWQANASFSDFQTILDTNGNYQTAKQQGLGPLSTGSTYPAFTANFGNLTPDGQLQWLNCGQPVAWLANYVFPIYTMILDTNGNLQLLTGYIGSSQKTGGAQPTWATLLGAVTADSGASWQCCGPGYVLEQATVQYAFSFHGVDGTVSTASTPFIIYGGILGMRPTGDIAGGGYLQIVLPVKFGGYQNGQVDQLWVWRTASGQATLILEDQIPSDYHSFFIFSFTYNEYGIADTSTTGNAALNPFIPAPVASSANPPPNGARPMCFAYQRVWYAVGNTLYYTAGPDAVTGNGLTQCPPLNELPFLGTVYAVRPVTVQGGALLAFTSAGIQIVLGNGTGALPFYSTVYYGSVNVSGFNAVSDLAGTTIFAMETNLKVSSIQVEYPFNPSTGYTEVGFAIGDQFAMTTTGGQNAALFAAAATAVSWCPASSSDTGMYVANAGFWFRMSAVSPPETGLLWSPLRQVAGGFSCAQSVQTSPGVYRLLMAPAAGTTGPLTMRDTTGTVWTDNGTAYPAWDVKGALLLCATGQWSEVAHISAKSAAVGARPQIGVLLNEIGTIPGTDATYTTLEATGPDPVRGRVSKSVFSDRYDLLQMGEEAMGDSLLVKFDYGTQAVGDRLLDFGIYATVTDEREEAASRS